jgi:hypothetical protein
MFPKKNGAPYKNNSDKMPLPDTILVFFAGLFNPAAVSLRSPLQRFARRAACACC